MKQKWIIIPMVLVTAFSSCKTDPAPTTSNKADFTSSFKTAQTGTASSQSSAGLKIKSLQAKIKLPSAIGLPLNTMIQPMVAAVDAFQKNPELFKHDPVAALNNLSSAWNASTRSSRITSTLATGSIDYTVSPPVETSDTKLQAKWNANLDGSGVGNDEILQLVIDWGYGSSNPPVPVWRSGAGATANFNDTPTKASAKLTVSGGSIGASITLLELNFNASWHPMTGVAGKYVSTPDSLSFNGFLFDGSVRLVEVRNFSISTSDTNVATAGDFSTVDAGTTSANWNISFGIAPRSTGLSLRTAQGNLDLNNARPSGAAAIDLAASNTPTSGSAASIQFKVNLNDWSYTSTGGLNAVTLSNGLLRINSHSVLLAGVLNDSNHNCIPGENVVLTFADGTTSLETFLDVEAGLTPGSCPSL